MLVIVLIAAIIFAIWRMRPSEHVTVEVFPTGVVNVSGFECSLSTVGDALQRERNWRQLWCMNNERVHLMPHPNTTHSDVIELVEVAQAAGYRRVVFMSSQDDQATPRPGPSQE